MFSTTQIDTLSQLVSQYDYYTAYYYGNYYEYQIGETRDNKIVVYCSDQEPTIEGDTHIFTDCNYYEVTLNKYILIDHFDSKQFTPLSGADIVYTNVVEGYPQLCYITSSFRQDAGPTVMYLTLGVAVLAILVRLIFGR